MNSLTETSSACPDITSQHQWPVPVKISTIPQKRMLKLEELKEKYSKKENKNSKWQYFRKTIFAAKKGAQLVRQIFWTDRILLNFLCFCRFAVFCWFLLTNKSAWFRHRSVQRGYMDLAEELPFAAVVSSDRLPFVCSFCFETSDDKPFNRCVQESIKVTSPRWFIFRCSRCKHICYCTRNCQKSDWEDHKVIVFSSKNFFFANFLLLAISK